MSRSLSPASLSALTLLPESPSPSPQTDRQTKRARLNLRLNPRPSKRKAECDASWPFSNSALGSNVPVRTRQKRRREQSSISKLFLYPVYNLLYADNRKAG